MKVRAAGQDRNRRNQEGTALLVTMMMLALMGLVGMASLDTATRERQVAGYSSLAQSALYAADAGVAEGLDLLRKEITGLAVTSGDCLSGDLLDTNLVLDPNDVESGSRTLTNGAYYEPDPTSPNGNEICMLATAEACEQVGGSLEMGQPIYLKTVWSVRVQGVAPGGATTRILATAERCHAFNN